jgi:serine/threonine protein kinase
VNEVKEHGNYEVPIEVKSNDEVGVLADSFKKLLGELKEKNNLVHYLSKQATGESISGAETVVQAVSPSAVHAHSALGDTLASIRTGTLIGNRYEVQSVLGTGGMGLVLKARDRQLDDVVALKMLKGEAIGKDPAALERFKQELKLARKITHRYILRTYDYSEIDTFYCISMEYVKGVTLKQLILQRGILPLKIAIQIAKQICSGLDAAHEKGIIHRDIKPQNILLESTGDVKIMDFGIAAVSDMQGLTMTGTVMGTPDYMSPEQAQGSAMDQRTDIYSTGVLMYEMFCGILPFIADKPLAVLHKHLHEPPQSPLAFNPHLPKELERILLKALSKTPEERYQKISLLYADLDALSGSLPEES